MWVCQNITKTLETVLEINFYSCLLLLESYEIMKGRSYSVESMAN